MAAQDNRDDAELSSSNLDAKLDRYRDPNKPTKSSSKSKDLSHVPCKFFKVGSCTAGQSCPFSHQIQQPGQAKDVCAWFVKGNCKFGHKCALAHILPGQSPSMDRRNKKAAQLAAAAAAANSGGNNNNNNSHTHGSSGGTRDRERDRERDRTRKSASSSTATSGSGGAGGLGAGRGGGGVLPSRSNTLLSGSTAPTRVLPTGARPPLPISISKAAPAPAETAPALRDADFTSRDALALPRSDDQAQAQTQNGAIVKTHGDGEAINEQVFDNNTDMNTNINPSNGVGVGVGVSSPPVHTSPFPVSTPSRPHRFAARHGSSPSIDFGPVGSPPRASSAVMNMNNNSGPIRINGFSPGTSPTGRDPVQGTQPLAAPVAGPAAFGAHGPAAANLFMAPSSPRGAGSGVAASLSVSAGAQPQGGPPPHTQPFAVGSLPVLSRPIQDSVSYSEALDEEDMEEFVPSSLKDLLTPEEQSRRMSRTSSSHMTPGTAVGGTGGGEIPTSVARSAVQREGLDTRHRHSQSVPSTSLLSENLRSIWADNNASGIDNNNNNPGFGLSPSAGAGGLAPPSFASSPGLQHAFDYDFEKDGPSPSMLSPSNASAAFLGMGMHQYMGAGTGGSSRVPGGIGGVRGVSQGNLQLHTGMTNTSGGIGVGNTGGMLPSASSSFDPHRLHGHAGGGLSSSPSHLPRTPFDTAAFSSSPSKYSLSYSTHRAVPNTASHAVGGFPVPEQALSPSSRALQTHVPGQSLPQGLAAGFSRIHLQPTGTGTGAGMAFSPGSGSGSGSQGAEGLGSLANGAGVMGMDWMSATPTKSNHFDQLAPPTSPPVNNTSTSEYSASVSANPTTTTTGNDQTQPDVGGLTSMFSHLSYSSVTAGSGGLRSLPSSSAAPPTSMSMSMSRRSSGRGVGVGGGAWPHPPHPLSSPLSGPVLTNDDDELFSMDEEK